ncbi:MAG TPA: ATP-binding cassette domain-containing protein [Actinomycetota bacterium]|nr:ATP-binding cassette domain-containing protein [Actinomycetota bacterium]
MRNQPVILAEGLSKSFGNIQALREVDLSVSAGSVLGLLGPNGAGKTTTVRILTTLLLPDAGSAWVAGFDVARQPASVRQVIGLAGQSAAVDEHLTGRENLLMVGRLYHLGRGETRRRSAELLERFDLVEAAERTVRTWSGGMRRRLDLAVSLIGQPQVLLLDEPSSGLDPRGRHQLWQTIRQLVDDGATVLLTTQYLEEADQLAGHIVVIDAGRIIAHGTPDQLKQRVGGDRLQLRLATPTTASRAAAVVTDLGSGPPQVDAQAGEVTLPITHGVAILSEVVRRLDAAGLALSDLALRRPTLDDVFLALTGQPTQPADRAGAPSAGPPDREGHAAAGSPA